jgi:transcriptional regulator with XRE-family HTH domain
MQLLPYPFGERLRARRDEAGLSLRQLGALCGMRCGQIQRYECGDRCPDRAIVQRLAAALKLDLDSLVGGTNWHCDLDARSWYPNTCGLSAAFGKRDYAPERRCATSVRLKAASELNPDAFRRLEQAILRRSDLPAARAFLAAASFDSGPEGLAAMQFLAGDSLPCSGHPQQLGFRKVRVVERKSGDIVGDCPVPALWQRLGGVDCVIIPRVSLRPAKVTYTVDFLVGVKGTRKTHWFLLEVDGAGHRSADDPLRDKELDMHVLRFDESELGRPDFLALVQQRLAQPLADNPWGK